MPTALSKPDTSFRASIRKLSRMVCAARSANFLLQRSNAASMRSSRYLRNPSCARLRMIWEVMKIIVGAIRCGVLCGTAGKQAQRRRPARRHHPERRQPRSGCVAMDEVSRMKEDPRTAVANEPNPAVRIRRAAVADAAEIARLSAQFGHPGPRA